jgi:hypothetical protein
MPFKKSNAPSVDAPGPSRKAGAMSAGAIAPLRAYLMKLRVSAADEAATLAEELEQHGASVERDGEVVTSIWRASDADHLHLWDEHDFPELRFFLRAWAGANEARQLVVLDERPIAC